MGWLAAIALAWAGDDERAQELFEQHRWFELRGMQASDPFGAAFIKGTLASVFNRTPEAEHFLKLAIHRARKTEQLNAAREKLVVLYLRQGRLAEAKSQMQAMLKREPSRADTQALMDLFAPLAGSGNFSARVPKAGTVLPCEVRPDGVWLSLMVNGQAVTWLLDTGLNFAVASESEARALGITVHEGSGAAHDLAGAETRTKSGMAARMAIGGIEFRNVPMLIAPDSQQPWADWKKGRKGAIGLPVALAMQTLSWKRGGTCAAGFESKASSTPNLALDDFTPVVRGALRGTPIDFVLDTGNQGGTQLWSRFKADFSAVVAAEGVTGASSEVHQIGGASERPTVEIPDLRFEVGGLAAQLKPALIFGKPVGTDYQHGLLGMDVFSQASEIVFDFRTMTFTAH